MRLSVWARWASILAYAALMGGQFFLLGGVFGAVLALPLLAVTIGLLRNRVYAGAAGSLLVLVYLGGWSVEAFARDPVPVPLMLMVWLALLGFLSNLLFVKWAAVEARAMRAARTESSDAAEH